MEIEQGANKKCDCSFSGIEYCPAHGGKWREGFWDHSKPGKPVWKDRKRKK